MSRLFLCTELPTSLLDSPDFYMNKKETIKTVEYVFSVIVALYILFLLYRIVDAVCVSAPYPNEYREAANIAMTKSILAGENIYSLESLAGAVPPVCYLYGPLMSLFAAALSHILPGVSLQVIHYGISILSIAVSAVFFSMMVNRYTKSSVAAPLAFLFMIFCHWRYGYGYAAPDSLGLCLMILVLFLLLKGVQREKRAAAGIDLYTEAAAFLTLATFFTKQYFLMIAGVGAVYLFIMSKKLFLRYASSGIVFSIIVFSALKAKCPLYLTYAIYFLKGPGPGAAMGKTGKAHNESQVMYLGGMLLVLFIAVAAYFLRIIYQQIRARKGEGRFLKYEKNEFVLLFMVQAAISALVLRYIGNNDGAFLSYYLQLFTPALAALSVYSLDLFGRDLKEPKRAGWIFIPLCVIFFGYTIYKTEPRLVIEKPDAKEISEWERAYRVLDGYIGEDIYYSTLLAFHGYENDQYVYDDGQQFVFTRKFRDSYEGSKLARQLFPYAGLVMDSHLLYREEMKDKLREGAYSLVMRLKDKDEIFDEEELKENYTLLDTYSLRAGSWSWDMEYWIRKDDMAER